MVCDKFTYFKLTNSKTSKSIKRLSLFKIILFNYSLNLLLPWFIDLLFAVHV